MRSHFGRSAVHVLAILAVAIYLVPGGAHLAEMASKMALPPAQYMVVQKIYAGWALFGLVLLAAVALTLLHAMMVWRQPAARWLSLLSLLSLLATQAVFWSITYPMNVLTGQWTRMPDDLDVVRRQWELSHAASAVLTFGALTLIVAAVVAAAHAPRDGGADRRQRPS